MFHTLINARKLLIHILEASYEKFHEESVSFDCPSITLKAFLSELSHRAFTPVNYVQPGTHFLDPNDWQISINSVPCRDCRDGLDSKLKDGDTVTINILVLGGG